MQAGGRMEGVGGIQTAGVAVTHVMHVFPLLLHHLRHLVVAPILFYQHGGKVTFCPVVSELDPWPQSLVTYPRGKEVRQPEGIVGKLCKLWKGCCCSP